MMSGRKKSREGGKEKKKEEGEKERKRLEDRIK